MDNFRIDVTGDDRESLTLALNLACNHCPGGTAKAFGIKKNKFVLFWTVPSRPPVGFTKFGEFPVAMDCLSLLGLVEKWLNQNPHQRDDHDEFIEGCDGDTKQGWRLYNEEWGHVDGMWQAFVAIEPITAYYGK